MAYDPFAAIEAAKVRAQTESEKYWAFKELQNTWGQRWADHKTSTDRDALMRVVEIVHHFRREMLLDRIECILARQKFLEPEVAESTWFACDYLAICLLQSAMSADLAAVETAMNTIAERSLSQQVADSLSLFGNCLEPWATNPETLRTPPVTEKELRQACGGNLTGFSKANINKRMAGKLMASNPKESGGATYWNFEHADLNTEMVAHVVAYLKKQKTGCFILRDEKDQKPATKRGAVSRKPR